VARVALPSPGSIALSFPARSICWLGSGEDSERMEEGEDSRLLCAMEVGGVSLSFGCVFSTLYVERESRVRCV
jgi:hypothetical protein